LKEFQVQTYTTITEERVKDLLCCAFEGGSNYWYFIQSYNHPNGVLPKMEFWYLDLPLLEGGSLTITAEGQPPKKLDLESIQRGLKLLPEKCPRQWADFIAEDEDAITGDCFLQLCLYGEVLFA